MMLIKYWMLQFDKLILCAIVLYFHNSVEANSCPKGCKCWNDGPSHISCDRLGWKDLSSLPKNVTDLSLQQNIFHELPNGILNYKKLKTLYLAGNKFNQVDAKGLKTFITLPVMVLDISHNPWDCSCNENMVKFVQWIKAMKTPTPSNPLEYKRWIAFANGYNTLCAKPNKLQGRRLDSLARSDMCP